MEQLTLEQATKSYIDGYVNSGPPVHDSYFDALNKSFKAGAEWRKEQYKDLLHFYKQAILAYNIRYPDAKQLLAGYSNEELLTKIETLHEQLED